MTAFDRFRRIDDRAAEAILSGRVPHDQEHLAPLAELAEMLRAELTSGPAPAADDVLARVLSDGDLPRDDVGAAVPPPTAPPSPATAPSRLRPSGVPALQALGAFVATLAGKVVVGTAVAAAAAGGAHAAGIVEVPGLPERGPAVQVEEPQQRQEHDLDAQDEPQADPAVIERTTPGVDGEAVSERARALDPGDGWQFGRQTAEEATEGTPGHDQLGTGDAAREEAPGGRGIGEQHREQAPSSPETGEQHRQQAPGGRETGEEQRDEAPAGRQTGEQRREQAPRGPHDAGQDRQRP